MTIINTAITAANSNGYNQNKNETYLDVFVHWCGATTINVAASNNVTLNLASIQLI